MKHTDSQKLREASFITGEQCDKIIARFNLKEDGGGKFLAIISIDQSVQIIPPHYLLKVSQTTPDLRIPITNAVEPKQTCQPAEQEENPEKGPRRSWARNHMENVNL